MKKVLGIVLILVATVGGRYCWKFAVVARDQQNRSIVLTGIVMDLELQRTKPGSSAYLPVIGFSDPKGKIVHFKSGLASNPPKYRRGDRVRVVYDPITQEGVLDNPMEVYGNAVAIFFPSLLAGAVGILLLVGAPLNVGSKFRHGLRGSA